MKDFEDFSTQNLITLRLYIHICSVVLKGYRTGGEMREYTLYKGKGESCILLVSTQTYLNRKKGKVATRCVELIKRIKEKNYGYSFNKARFREKMMLNSDPVSPCTSFNTDK